jgi:proton-translocating NADH-quinone oxidoreductase chain N
MLAILPLLLLIAGAMVAMLSGRNDGSKGNKEIGGITAFGFSATALAVAIYAAMEVWDNGTIEFVLGASTLQFDALSAMMSIVALGLLSAVSLYSVKYMEHDKGTDLYYPLLLLMVAGIVGITMATDLIVLYVFFELMCVPSYALVAFRKDDWNAVEAGLKYIMMSAVGSVIALFGLSLIYMDAGTLSYDGLVGVLSSGPTAKAAILMLIAGFGFKAALAPLHTWLPDAHSAAPSGISAMLSGIVIQAGLFTLMKALLVFSGTDVGYGALLVVMALITMTVGNIMAYVQFAYQKADIKRILAYSSVAQMGYIALGIGLGLEYGVRSGFEGGMFHIMTHAFMKGLAFLCAGAIIHQLGTRDVKCMRGIGHSMKITAFCLAIALLSLAGAPPMSGFMSEWLVFRGAMDTSPIIGAWSVAIIGIALFNTLLALGYYLPIIKSLYLGGKTKEAVMAKDPPAYMLAPIVALAAATVVLGIWPELGLRIIKPAVDLLMQLAGWGVLP